MGRVDKISYYLKKSASSTEQDFEWDKVRASEKRAGITLGDFESEVEMIVLELYGEEINLQEIVMKEFSNEGNHFNSPYDFLTKGLSPKSYAIYLRMKNLV
jgi:hypothetical protein